MFASVAETVVGTACGQIGVGEKQQNRRSQSVAVVRLHDQSVFAVNDDFRHVPDAVERPPALNERFAQKQSATLRCGATRSRPCSRPPVCLEYPSDIPSSTRCRSGRLDRLPFAPISPAPAAGASADENQNAHPAAGDARFARLPLIELAFVGRIMRCSDDRCFRRKSPSRRNFIGSCLGENFSRSTGRSDHFDFFGRDPVLLDEFFFDHLGVGGQFLRNPVPGK